jgi:hypothetical protein
MHVQPLGIFGVLAGQREFARLQDELRHISGAIPIDEREPIARYLASCSMIFPVMEHTFDVIEKAFGTPGGSAICTDGTYYWRLDAADYVRHYGVALPEDFIAHGRRLQWNPPRLREEDIARIDDYLIENVRRLRADVR